MSKSKRSLLEMVAKEMNEIMQLTPAIEISEAITDEALLDTICREATGNGIPKDAIRVDDTFTAEAWAFFVQSGVWNEKGKCVITKKDEATKEPTATEGKAEPKMAATKKAATKKAATKKAATKKAATKKETKTAANLDKYGFRDDSMSSKAIALFETGKFTMAEAMKKVGSSTDFNYALRKIKTANKHKVSIDDKNKITVK